MPIAIYARKSTDREDRQVQSLDDQLRLLNELAAREGLVVAETFVESGSAKAPGTRPEFQRLLGEIEAGRIDGVLTWSVNRLSRNPVDGGHVAYHLQTGRLRYIRTTERTYLPEDNALIMAIENGMATNTLQELSRNVRRGLRGKADRGWHPGRAPFGYVNERDTREIVPDPSRFRLLRKGWELLLSGGYTVAEVHRELAALGLTGVQRGSARRPIAPSVLYKVFASRFYLGEFSFAGEWRAGRHQPMVTPEEFEAAQRILARGNARKARVHERLYSGVLRCGACGCRVVGETKRKEYRTTGRSATYTYYHCTGFRGCSKRGLPEWRITEEVLGLIERIRVPRSFVEWARWALLNLLEGDGTAVAEAASRLRTQVQDEEARIARLRELRISDDLDGEEYRLLKAEAEGRKADLARKLERAVSDGERTHRYAMERLELAERADRYGELPIAAKRGVIIGLGPAHSLTLERLEIKLDAVLEKIAAFEPLRNGSQIPKVGDLVPLNSVWYGLLEDIRAAARLEVKRLDDEEERRA